MSGSAHADQRRDARDGWVGFSAQPVDRGIYREPRFESSARQYTGEMQDYRARGGQRGERRYLPDPRQHEVERDSYPVRNPQYSREEAERAERDRQSERRALLRRQINEARDLYAPVRKR